MNHVSEVSNLKKLSIEKKTIRNLTDVETDEVGGGISPILISSAVCAETIVITVVAISAAYC